MGHRTLGRFADIGFALFILLTLTTSVWSLRYHASRLEREAVQSHQQLAEVHAIQGIEHFSQTVSNVGLLMRSLLESGYAERSTPGWQAMLHAALRNAPHLRALALLDDRNVVVISTQADDLGHAIAFDDYLPRTEDHSDLLRIGPPFAGRSLADGRKIADRAGTPPELSFIPVLRSISMGEGSRISLLALLNADYFINRLRHEALAVPVEYDLIRFDGVTLLSTRESPHSATLIGEDVRIATLWQAGTELGKGEISDGSGTPCCIQAHRLDRVLPVGIVARIDIGSVTAPARAEGRKQQLVLLPLVGIALLVVLTAYIMLRNISRRQFRAQQHELQRFGNLLDTLPAAVLLFDADERLVLSNRTWTETRPGSTATDKDNTTSQPLKLAGLLHELGATDAAIRGTVTGLRALLTGEAREVGEEFSTTAPDGSTRAFQLLARPFASSAGTGLTVLILDTTRRRMAEDALRLNSRVFELSTEAILVTDADNRILTINPAFTRITGYAPDESIGRNPSMLSSGSHDSAFYARMWETLAQENLWQGEIINCRKDGSRYPQWLTISVDRDAQGAVRHYIGVFVDISGLKATERALRESEERYRTTFAAIREGMWEWDVASGRIRADHRWFEMLGHPPEAFPMSFAHWKAELVHPDDLQSTLETLEDAVRARRSFAFEFRMRCADGSWRWIESRGDFVAWDGDTPLRALGTHSDVHARHEAEEEMALLRAAVNAAASGIVITDTNAIIRWANPAFAELTGYSVEEAIGRKPKELVRSGLQDRSFYDNLWATITAGQVWRGELVNKRKDDSLYHESLIIAPVPDRRGVIRHYVAIKEDISARKVLEARLIELARTDSLTGLPNRRAFMEGLRHELERMRRGGHPPSVLMVDIDFFKRVNDQYGHAAGDKVLKAVAAIIRDEVRSTDALGRIGGEEFAVATSDSPPDTVGELAERLRGAVAATTFDSGEGRQLHVTLSIGVATARRDDTADTILSRADAALYDAKSSGRNRVVVNA